LLLGRRRDRRALSGPGPDALARRARDLQERARAARRRALRPRGSARRRNGLPISAARAPPWPAKRARAREADGGPHRPTARRGPRGARRRDERQREATLPPSAG